MGQLQFKERARSLEWLRREAEALSMRDELEAEELEGPALVALLECRRLRKAIRRAPPGV